MPMGQISFEAASGLHVSLGHFNQGRTFLEFLEGSTVVKSISEEMSMV